MDIYPNPVMLSYWGQNSIIFPMRVDVSPDTPNGTYKAKVIATALPGPGSILYNEAYNNKTATRFYGYFTLAVGKCGEPLPGATTTTASTTTTTSTPTTTSTISTTTTVTTIVTTTLSPTLTSATTIQLGEQQPPDTTYAWAVSATVATIVLAVVLFLRRNKY